MTHSLPPTETELPSQASILLGKPVPSIVRVVPPPTLPDFGLKSTMLRLRVKVTSPCAFPLDLTHMLTSRSPAGPFSSVHVTDVALASVTSHPLPPMSMLKSSTSSVNPVPEMVRMIEPSMRSEETPVTVGVRLES